MKLQYKSKHFENLQFTNYELQEIISAGNFFTYNGVNFSQISKHIKVLKENNVSFARLILRLEKILKLGRDSTSKKSCFYRYGLKQGYKKYMSKKKASAITKQHLISKYGKEKAESLLKSRGASLENYISRYGKKEGYERWENYKEKRKDSYKRKHELGHQFPKYNMDYFIQLYGKEKGSEIYSNKIESQRYKVSLKRYLDEFGDKGYEICRRVKDTQSLPVVIERYGREKGLEIYHERCEKHRGTVIEKIKKRYPDTWKKEYEKYLTNRFIPTKDNFIKRYGKLIGTEKYEAHLVKSANSYRRNSVSLVSTELFDQVKLIVPDLTNYGKKELTILLTPCERITYNRVYLKADCEYNKKIIEFNGDAFHANPKIYKGCDKPHPFLKDLSAHEIWGKDLNKRQILESRGYQVMYVWGSDYAANKSGIIKECVKFLTM
jgi:hypothetical protein